MPFDQNSLPEWNATGVEPPQSKKDNGWGPGEKPPADWFNWFFSKTYNALKSLFDNAQHKEEKGQPNGYAGLDANGKVPASQLNITKDQVGLGNVDNVKQAAKTDFDAHIADTTVHITADERAAWNAKAEKSVATQTSDGLMSKADKTKLDGIAAGAEVNQNAFSNVKVGSTTVAADSKTDTLELVAGSNITLTPDATNDKVTIAANVPVSSVNGKTGAVSLAFSDIQSKPTTLSGYGITDATPSSHIGSGGSAHATATSSSSGFMSAADKAKLDGIASGAEVNQNAFSNVKVGATTIAADAEQDTLELAAGTGITLTPDANNDKVTIAANAASTSAAGIVQLNDATNSTSTTQAATANAVKQANDNANSRVSKSGDTMSGRLQFGAGQDIATDAVSGATPSQGIRFSADTDIIDLFMRTDNVGEKSGLILALGDNSDDYFQIEQVSPAGEATPTKLFKISETEGANFLVPLKQNGSQVETTSGAQTKANTAESNAKAYTDTAPETMQRNLGIFNVSKSGKDSNGVFTTVDYKRSNGTLFARSVLSNADTNGNYQTRTITYYATDGTTVVRTDTWTLTYDADGDLVSEVKS